MKQIMVIEDDTHIGNMLTEVLGQEGYQVLRAYSGTEALLVLGEKRPDLILLDLMLPGLSGEELLPKIQNIPVIIVSAKTGIEDKVRTLLDGAVDYITKPFEIRELLARITVQLRKTVPGERDGWLVEGNIRLDLSSHDTLVGEREVKLTKTEFAILKLLLQNAGRAISKTVILERISLDTPDCTEGSLKQHISNLRKKLKEADGADHIEAVWGIGFRLVV